MLGRGFVLVPLAELAKDLRMPGDGRRIDEILASRDFERVQALFPGEELVR